jgi:hypothetical protein
MNGETVELNHTVASGAQHEPPNITEKARPMTINVNEFSEDDLYEMANIYPDDSGLTMTVWVRPRNEPHGPRIKVCTIPGPRMHPYHTVTVTLPPVIRVIPPGGLSPADLHLVEQWIRLNETAIRAHWSGQISSIEFGRQLIKLFP